MKFLAVAGTWVGLMLLAVGLGMGVGLMCRNGGIGVVVLVSFAVSMPFGFLATCAAMRVADRYWP